MNKYVLGLCLLVHLSNLDLNAQACQCSISEVEENTVVPCDLSIGEEIIVSSVAEFKNAINQVNANGGNMTILIEDGDYQVASTSSFPYITGSHVVIRSLSGNRDAVVLRGGGMMSTSSTEDGLLIAGHHVTIADLTIREVGNHGIQVSGHHLFVHNVRIQNTYEQMLKGSTSAETIDSAIVQCSLFEYPAGIGPQWYIGGLDIHKGVNWIVRDNVFMNIKSPSQAVAEHAVHFWNNSSENIVERNLIINCDRGIGFGLGSSPNTGGIIRNNMIYNDGFALFADVGIGLETSPNTRVYNNSIFIEYPNAIEYRFEETKNVEIVNNLSNQPIKSRNGGSANLTTNIIDAKPEWFEDYQTGNLRLASDPDESLGLGTNIYDYVKDDHDQNLRPMNDPFYIGAHEYKFSVQTDDKNSEALNLKLYPNPTTGLIHLAYMNSNSGRIDFFNGLGVKLLSQSIQNGKNTLDISALPVSIYHYNVYDGSNEIHGSGIVVKH